MFIYLFPGSRVTTDQRVVARQVIKNSYFVIHGVHLAKSMIEKNMLGRFRSHFQTNFRRVDLKRAITPFNFYK